MASWYDPLLALLADQPAATATVTVTLSDLERLAGQSLPAGAYARAYWLRVGRRSIHGRLAAIGWRSERFDRYGQVVTFARLPAASTASLPARPQ